VNNSARFSSGEPAPGAGRVVASRLQSDRLALTGRAGQGVVAYRSEFLHLWVIGPAELDPQAVIEGLADLERAAFGLPQGVIPPPGIGLPVEVQHALAGIQFLKDTLWEWRPECVGLIRFEGRAFAIRTGLEVQLEQLTGAPTRWRWHEWEDGSPLAWMELAAAEVWRLGVQQVSGALFAHYRPALAPVPELSTDADSFAAAAQAAAHAAEYPATSTPGPDAHVRESRQARRRRHRRETAREEPAHEPAPELELAPAPEPVPPVAPEPEPQVMREPEPQVTPEPEPEVTPEPEPEPEVPREPEPEVVMEPTAYVEPTLIPRVTIPTPARAPTPLRMPTPARAPQRTPARVPASPRQLATPRLAPGLKLRLPRIDSWPRTIVFGSAASVLVIALIVAGIAARKPIAALVVGRYALALETSPAGARVRVDGKPVAGRTPLTLALTPGDHVVELNYGDYAKAGFTIEGARGDALKRTFAWTGALGVASADSSVRLAVKLDGKSLGHAPLWQETVPVGRHRLAFSAPGVRAWEEEVQVRSGQSARVTAVPVKVPPYGLVTARAQLVSSDGVEDLDGMPVFVDGVSAGVTPVDLKLVPGPHSIRIARGGGAPSIHMIDVQPGGRFFASAEFGRPADPLVAFDPPAKLARAAPPTITVRLAAELPLPIRQASLYVRPDGGAFARMPIAWTTVNGRGQGTFTFPLDRLGSARTVSYYVEIETREGEEYYSELRTVPIVP
jgi:hypothetical protein